MERCGADNVADFGVGTCFEQQLQRARVVFVRTEVLYP